LTLLKRHVKVPLKSFRRTHVTPAESLTKPKKAPELTQPAVFVFNLWLWGLYLGVEAIFSDLLILALV